MDERRSFLNFTTKAYGNCVSEEAVTQTSCSGNCYGQEEVTLEMSDNAELVLGLQSCTCCRGTVGEILRIKVKCRHPDSYLASDLEVNMPYFTGCSCRECLEGQNHQILDLLLTLHAISKWFLDCIS